MRVRNNLIEFRHKLGLTQEEFGSMFKQSRGQWCNIEVGRKKGSAEMWLELGNKFDLTVKELKKLMEVA